jgi:voltage-gated potassium channel
MNDIIICGYGTVGKKVAERLKKNDISYIAIDEKDRFDDDSNIILGNAASEEVLKQAGIENAKTIIAVTNNDVTNTFITLLAKNINKNITILARVVEMENIEKLNRAGADYVFPMAMTGRFIAKSAIEPFVADFLDMINLKGGIEIFQIDVSDNSKIANSSIKKADIWKRTKTHILAIKRGNQTIYSISEDEQIKPGDTLLVIGSGEQIKALHNLADPEKTIQTINK